MPKLLVITVPEHFIANYEEAIMLRRLLLTLIFITSPFLIHANETIKIAATPVPHAEILEFIQPLLAKEGITLEILVFNDYIQPNIQVSEKLLDANFFQHKPYLDEFNQATNTTLVSVAGVHIEPMGGYSKKITQLSELKKGAKIAIPNDVTNGGRGLILLHQYGLITLKDPTNILSNTNDIIENPQQFKFIELEAAMIPRTINELDLALINTNYALDAGFNPQKDALLIENEQSPYTNIVAMLPEFKDSPQIKKFIEILRSEATRQFILEHYKGSILPAF